MANKNFKKKEEFIILADVPPIPTPERLIKYKQAGFNYYNLTEDYIVRDNPDKTISDEYFKAIEHCKEQGLKVMLRTMDNGSIHYYDNVKDEFLGKADGYYITDEPSPTVLDWYCKYAIKDYIRLVDWYNEHGGDTFFHLNLLQDYGMTLLYGKENAPRYEEDYLDYYIEEILKKVKGEKSLGTDHYPMASENGVNYIKPTAIRDYFRLAERTKKLIAEGHDVRTGICIQLVSNEGLRLREIETYEDVDFQVNLALVFGAKLIEYYIYANKGFANPGTAVLCDDDQVVYTKTYDHVKRANERAVALGKYYLPFEWVGAKTYAGSAYHNDYNAQAFELCKGKEIENFERLKDFTCSADAIVAEFNDGDKLAYMAVNYTEPSENVENALTFKFDGVKTVTAVICGVAKKVELVDGVFSVNLKAGESVFVVIN
ncbi:MAG: hypothetical protein IJV95_00870 [Clostridia bacterium]|nr:hypothetical protein [Clostridia bacterium]